MPFKTFAVAGAGNIGAFISEELLKQKAVGKASEVKVFTRPASTNEAINKLAANGATVVAINYSSKASLTSALAGVDVVICTFSPAAFQEQTTLAEAAKAAGAKLFVPSEFGNSTENANEGPLAAKKKFQSTLQELGIPYALFFTGPFPDFCFTPFLGLDLENAKVIVGGDGNTLISWTARRDVARYLAYVLTTLPSEKILGRTFRVEGERASFNDIFRSYEAKTGKKLEVTYKSAAELQAAFTSNPHDLASLLHFAWSVGGGTVGNSEDVTNGEFPDFKPAKVIDVFVPQ